MCQLPSFSKLIFHTHPLSVRSYPSTEEVVENPNIHGSVVISFWEILLIERIINPIS